MLPPPPKAPLVLLGGLFAAALMACTAIGSWLGAVLAATNTIAAWQLWRSYVAARDSYIEMETVRLKFLNSPEGRAYTFCLCWSAWCVKCKRRAGEL